MAYVSGKALTGTAVIGSTTLTLAVQDANIEDGGDKLDATNTTSGGNQALMAGIARMMKSVKFLLDTAAAYYSVIRFGAKGTATFEVSAGKTYILPFMVTKVGVARPCNGLVVVDATLEGDSITAAPTYPS